MIAQRYGKTDAEIEAEESLQCREIVREIARFGVSQKQLYKIISLIALELENIEHMRKITAMLEDLQASKKLLMPSETEE